MFTTLPELRKHASNIQTK